MSSRRQKLLARVNWYLQSSLKHITELITGNKSFCRGGRYRQVSLYLKQITLTNFSHKTTIVAFTIMTNFSYKTTMASFINKISMVYFKTAVSPLLMHWRYCSLAQNRQFISDKITLSSRQPIDNCTLQKIIEYNYLSMSQIQSWFSQFHIN